MNPLLRRRTARWLAVCALVVLGGGCSPSPDSQLQSAREAIARHDSRAAVITLKGLLQEAPDSPEARFLIGSAFLELGDASAAEVELRKALELKHPPDAVVPALARSLLLGEQYKKLTTEFGSTELTDASARADLGASLAAAYARQGQGKAALETLAAALSAAPQHGRALALQARFKAEAGDVDGALALIDDMLRQDPGNVDAWQLKADLLYIAKHDAAASLAAHRQLLKIRPDLASAHAGILSILVEQNDVEAAKGQLAELKKIAPTQPQTRYFEAQIAFLQRDFETAEAIALELLKFAPDDARVLQLAGAVALQTGALPQATAHLQKALQTAPSASTRRLLAQVHLKSGEPDKALQVLGPLLRAPTPGAPTLALAAQAHLVKGDARVAEDYFARAAKLDPGDTGSRIALALAQLAKGNAKEGYSQLEAIAAAETDTSADLVLVSTRLRRGDFDEALKALDGYERKQPGTAMAAHLRGMIQLARKDPDAGGKSFERALAIDPVYFPAVLGLVAIDLAQGKPEQARKRFDAVLAVDNKNVQALLGVAGLRASAGASPQELTGLLANAVRLNPESVEARLRLIEAQVKAGDPKAALATAQAGVAAVPDSPELHAALGRLQTAAGESGQAIATYNKLVELAPRSAEPHLRLGDLYLAGGNQASARQSYQRALALAPGLLGAQRGMISLEVAAGRTKEALAMARSVRAVPAQAAAGWLFEGDIETARKDWPAAVAAYRASLKLDDAGETAIKLYFALQKSKQAAEADRLVADWTQRHPKDPSLLAYAGNLAVMRGDFAAAEGIYRSIVAMQPDNATALNNLAVILARLGKPEALAAAEKANALQPGDAAYMDTHARLLADAGQMAKALEVEKKAVELHPGNHALRLNLARLYLRADQKPQARRELEQLAALGDAFGDHKEVTKLLGGL